MDVGVHRSDSTAARPAGTPPVRGEPSALLRYSVANRRRAPPQRRPLVSAPSRSAVAHRPKRADPLCAQLPDRFSGRFLFRRVNAELSQLNVDRIQLALAKLLDCKGEFLIGSTSCCTVSTLRCPDVVASILPLIVSSLAVAIPIARPYKFV
jgi:hypothetical protein